MAASSGLGGESSAAKLASCIRTMQPWDTYSIATMKLVYILPALLHRSDDLVAGNDRKLVCG
jgi:hypothetical protein